MIKLPKHLTDPNPNVYLTDNCWVVDFETTNLDAGDPVNNKNKLLLAVAKHVGSGELIISWGSEFEQSYLLERLASADYIIAQGAKFELGWLRRCGGDLSSYISYCTVIGQYVLDGNRKTQRDLDSLARLYRTRGKESKVAAMIETGICPSQIPKSWLEEYCIADVEAEYEIFLKQRKLLAESGLLPVAYSRNLFTPVLADIEFNGMQLDKDRVNQVYRKYKDEYDIAITHLKEFSGAINWNSPDQLSKFIYDDLGFREVRNHYGKPITTEGGKRSTSQKTLAKLKPTNSKQRKFLEVYTKVNKLETALTKYLEKFKECCDTDNGLLRAKFNQTVVVTHRLSSTGEGRYKVQLHNMDRNFKPLFRARQGGWGIGEADEAQLEYRIAVELGNDELGRKRIADKFDVHAHTASIMTAAGQPTDRQGAKEHTFKPLFFGSSGTEAEQAYYKKFKEEHKGIAAVHEKWTYEALRTGRLIGPTGFISYWPGTKMTKTGYITNSTQICNYFVQHIATAEIVPIGVIFLWHYLKALNMQTFIINTIHDSVIAEVHPEEKDRFNELCSLSLQKDVLYLLKKLYNMDFSVPLDIEIKHSKFWNDSDKWQEKYLN